MPFVAKSAAPVAPDPAARHWTFDRAALGGLTVFVAPPEYLLSEGLFEAVARQGRPVVWVRLGPEDHDPGSLLRSLVAAVQRHHPGLGRDVLAPPGWPERFGRLAAELAAATPAPTALVVEHAHHLGGGRPPGGSGDPGPALLGSLLGRLLDGGLACAVTSDEPLPAGALPARGATVTADDLRLDPVAAAELLGRAAPRLPAAASRRAVTLCQGAAADLAAVAAATAALGPARVEQALDRAGRVEDLLADLAAGWLGETGPDGHRALALALAAGYSHPVLSAAVLGAAAAPPAGPWLQPLADGWSTLRARWRDPLQAALAPTRPRGGDPPDRPADPPGPPDAPPQGPVLSIHLLGRLEVRLDGVTVDDWPSGRGRSLLKYLVSHREPWPTTEQLMDAFWPDAAPAAARNSLHVAVHGLRRAFRAAAEVPVVVLEGGAYRLGRDLGLWLDVDEFERHAAAGRRLEAAGELAAAGTEYERAVALYQGDFLADDPYEDWPALPREQLLLTYLGVLDRLSALYFGQRRYGACVALCRLLVERDPCREDAHRRLMRCFTRQGQPHLALRQYQACVAALGRELGIDPDPATTALARQVRQHQPV